MTRTLRALNLALLALCLGWLALRHVDLIRFPYPLESGEGCMLMSTQLMAEGKNPWALERQPQAANVYGAPYNAVAAALGLCFGGLDLAGHRALSGVFIVLSCLMVAALARRLQGDALASAWLGTALYACLLNYTTPMARPDSMGMFLYLAAILFPLAFENRPRAWILAGIFAVAAALTKPYFGCAIAVLLGWLALKRSWADLARCALGAAASALPAGLAIYLWGDTYAYSTLASNLSPDVVNSPAYVRTQLLAYALHFAVLLPSFAWLLARGLKKGLPAPPQPWLFASWISLAVFVLKLGGNYGSFVVYLFHLNLAPMLLALAALWPAAPRWRAALPWILAGQVGLLLWRVAPQDPAADPLIRQSWGTVLSEVENSRRLFAPWDLAPWQLSHGREVQDAGHRAFFSYGAREALRRPGIFSRGAELMAQIEKVTEREDRELRAGAYDLVLLHQSDARHAALLGSRYIRLGWVPLFYPQGKTRVALVAYRLKAAP